MMLLAGASRTVAAASWPPGLAWAAARGAEAAAEGTAAPASPLAGTAVPAAAWPAELAALLEVPAEHPARNMPPPRRTLPIMRPATVPGRVRPGRVVRRVRFRVFSMP